MAHSATRVVAHATSEHSIEPFRTTGSSPGTHGEFIATIDLEHTPSARVRIRWEAHGRHGQPAVVVLGGISADRHLLPTAARPEEGWWASVVGARGPLDPRRRRLVSLDYIVGPHPERAPITTRDQARAVIAALDHLGVERATVVGSSYGGMVALALAAHHPDRTDHVIAACAAHRPHPMATAIRSLQREIVRHGIASGQGLEAVARARALAMTTYRSSLEFDARFAHAAEPATGTRRVFPVERYLRARGRSFARSFDAERFVRLSESIDLHDVDPADLSVPLGLISVDTDAVVPPFLVDELAERAPRVLSHRRISSVRGHDAFLTEPQAFRAAIDAAFGAKEVCA